MSFSDRLLEVFDGASVAEIARRLRLPDSTVRNYINHDRLPSAEVLIDITNRTNVSLHWLLTGEGSKSTSSSSAGDINGLLNQEDVNAIERLRQRWEDRQGFRVSWDDFVRTLIVWGQLGVSHNDFEERFADQFRDIEYIANVNGIVARSLIELIRVALISGDLRETVANIVHEEVGGHAQMKDADMIVAPSIGKIEDDGEEKKRKTN